ncbi:MAG: serine hydrolase domain-containing protein [Acidimicrobiia bacterium]
MTALAAIDSWPVRTASVAVIGPAGVVARRGATDRVLPIASVSKLLTAWGVLIAVEEGVLALDEPAGPPGATVRHLLAHAAGYAFDGPDPVGRPGVKRIYSNTGYEVLGGHLARASGLDVATYVREAVLVPLAMADTDASGSPAHGFRSTVDDLARFAGEMLRPTLLAPVTVAEATRVQFADLGGILPGVGRFSPNAWGLGPEIRDAKQPHWTGTTNSPATYGHFGGSGTFLWVDPAIDLACVMLADRPFDEWGLAHWPALSDAVVAEHGGAG